MIRHCEINCSLIIVYNMYNRMLYNDCHCSRNTKTHTHTPTHMHARTQTRTYYTQGVSKFRDTKYYSKKVLEKLSKKVIDKFLSSNFWDDENL